VSLTGKDPEVLTELADEQIVPYFERQGGVASVNIEGGKEREIQVVLDKAKLKQYGLNAETVTQALNSSNQSVSAGTVEKVNQNLHSPCTGAITSIDDTK